MGNLRDISSAISAADRLRREKHKRFNEKLGEPAVFVPYPDDDKGHGVGYFRAGDGVVSYVRYSNGYNESSRVDYTASLIDILNTVRMV